MTAVASSVLPCRKNESPPLEGTHNISDAADQGLFGQSSIIAFNAAASSLQLASTPSVNSPLKLRQVTRPELMVVTVEVTDVVTVDDCEEVAVLVAVDVSVAVVTVDDAVVDAEVVWEEVAELVPVDDPVDDAVLEAVEVIEDDPVDETLVVSDDVSVDVIVDVTLDDTELDAVLEAVVVTVVDGVVRLHSRKLPIRIWNMASSNASTNSVQLLDADDRRNPAPVHANVLGW
jgi:hypothetical protein